MRPTRLPALLLVATSTVACPEILPPMAPPVDTGVIAPMPPPVDTGEEPPMPPPETGDTGQASAVPPSLSPPPTGPALVRRIV